MKRKWIFILFIAGFFLSSFYIHPGVQANEKEAITGHMIVFVHGYADHSARFREMVQYLESHHEGYHPVKMIVTKDGEGKIDSDDPFAYANRLLLSIEFEDNQGHPSNQTEALMNLFNQPRYQNYFIDFVTHSMGGLVVYDYLSQIQMSSPGENTRYGKFVAISTPFLGVNLAKSFKQLPESTTDWIRENWGFDGGAEALVALSNEDGYLNELWSRPAMTHIQTVTISSKYERQRSLWKLGWFRIFQNEFTDGVVSVNSSKSLPESDDFIIEDDPPWHLDIPIDPRVIQYVDRFINWHEVEEINGEVDQNEKTNAFLE